MADSVPLQIAETLQTASIKCDPSPTHDLNPSTAASSKRPVSIHHPPSTNSSEKYTSYDDYGLDEEEDENEDIPYSVLKPLPRRRGSFGPLPDLRFEQSYLASIAGAETSARVAWITIRDQVLMPLLQGTVWSLAIHGWRYYNRSATLSGSSVGARVRRWWYKTNNWRLPVSLKDFGKNSRLAGEMGDYYQNQNSGD